MQASTCNERFPLSVHIARDTSRFVIFGHREPGPKLFSPEHGVFGNGISALGVRSPLQNPGEIARAAELVTDKKTKERKKGKNNESSDSV
jgi:hypothetical protein